MELAQVSLFFRTSSTFSCFPLISVFSACVESKEIGHDFHLLIKVMSTVPRTKINK